MVGAGRTPIKTHDPQGHQQPVHVHSIGAFPTCMLYSMLSKACLLQTGSMYPITVTAGIL
jgi:hypothetical protein